MIHMVTPENRRYFAAELAEMHALRKVHFVDERGWSQMNVRNGGEFDECDDERTIYFLALDEHGQIGVSMRARPTDDKCIVADVFPQLIHPDNAPVKSENTWEISRIFATRAFRTRAGLRRRDQVFLASMEAAVEYGVTRLVGIIDTYLLPQAMRFPWRLTPLGLLTAYAEGEMIGVQIPVNRDELNNAREAMAQEGSIITTMAPVLNRLSALSSSDLEALVTASRLPERDLLRLLTIVGDVIAVQDQVSETQVLGMVDRAIAELRATPVTN